MKGEGWMDAGAEGTTKGEQPPYVSEGRVTLASPGPLHLPQGVSGECPSKLPQHQSPTPGPPRPCVLYPGEDVR